MGTQERGVVVQGLAERGSWGAEIRSEGGWGVDVSRGGIWGAKVSVEVSREVGLGCRADQKGVGEQRATGGVGVQSLAKKGVLGVKQRRVKG